MLEVEVEPTPLTRLSAILTPTRMEQLRASAARAREAFGDRVVWHVNATAHGGGVAEMLQNLLAYGEGRRDREPLAGPRRRPGVLRDHQAAAQPAAR